MANRPTNGRLAPARPTRRPFGGQLHSSLCDPAVGVDPRKKSRLGPHSGRAGRSTAGTPRDAASAPMSGPPTPARSTRRPFSGQLPWLPTGRGELTRERTTRTGTTEEPSVRRSTRQLASDRGELTCEQSTRERSTHLARPTNCPSNGQLPRLAISPTELTRERTARTGTTEEPSVRRSTRLLANIRGELTRERSTHLARPTNCPSNGQLPRLAISPTELTRQRTARTGTTEEPPVRRSTRQLANIRGELTCEQSTHLARPTNCPSNGQTPDSPSAPPS